MSVEPAKQGEPSLSARGEQVRVRPSEEVTDVLRVFCLLSGREKVRVVYTLSRLSGLRTRTVCVVHRITTRYRGPIVLCSVNGSDSIVLRLTLGTFCPRGPPFPFLRIGAA